MSIAQSCPKLLSSEVFKVYIGFNVTYVFKWLISQNKIRLIKVPFLRYCHIYTIEKEKRKPGNEEARCLLGQVGGTAPWIQPVRG